MVFVVVGVESCADEGLKGRMISARRAFLLDLLRDPPRYVVIHRYGIDG